MKTRDIHKAREHLFSALDDLLIATTCGSYYDRARHTDPAVESLKAAAALLGLNLVERTDPLVETIPHAMQRVGFSPDDPRN